MLKNEQGRTSESKEKSDARKDQGAEVNFWWVNQGKSKGKTFDIEKQKGIVSVPQREHEMRTYPQHWKNISELKKGDIIFHYTKKAVRAISKVVGDSVVKIKREKDVFEHENGLAVKVEYFDIDEINYQDIRPRVTAFKKTLPQKYSPFNCKDKVNQGYLYEFSFEGAKEIREIFREIYDKPFPSEIERYFK